MGIRDKRFFRAVNRIIREELQKGNLPTSKEFSYRLNQYLAENDLSRPEYNFKPVRDGNTARSLDYNNTMNTVYRDLSTLYENTIDMQNELSKNFSKFEVDKSSLEYEVNVLQNQLQEDILLYNNNGYLNTVYDVFDDMSKVDSSTTDAHVDIKLHEVSLPELKNTSTKINPSSKVRFDILPEIASSVQVVPISGTPQDAMSDAINSTWQELVLTNIKQNVGGYFFIQFDNKQSLNRIQIDLLGAKPTLVRIEFSPDSGTNWFVLPYYEDGKTVSDAYSFEFPSIDADMIRILLQKSEPDDASTANNFAKNVDTNQYQYIIGLKHIGLFQMQYPPQATLYSTPLKVDVSAGTNFTISQVSLSVDETIVPATDIEYYIAIPPASGQQPDWKQLSPVGRQNPAYDQIIDFRNIQNSPATKMVIDPNLSLNEYIREDLQANGITFYQIGSVDNKQIVNSTERLYAGANAWGIKKFAYQQPDHATHIPTMNDWASPQDYEYDFVQIQDGKPGLLMNTVANTTAYNYMFTVGVLSGKAQNVTTCIPASTDPITIYVNGQQVFSGIPDKSSKVPFTFNYGWNEVVVLLYTRSVGTANGTTFDMNIDMRTLGSNVYSQAKPMNLVSLHDLRYNVKSNDRTSYAIEVVNNTANIILNYADPGLQYDFYYNYIQGDVQDTILFKAELMKNDTASSISPKLTSYRLRFA